ncbi:MAG: glycosyltransferase family 2 protein, partial [Lentisphaerae bacterium]|nr:glycosyltransferase family 2 protein [Lentisphaerota bacterium]
MKQTIQVLDISVVIPVYNSAEIFPTLYARLCDVLEKISGSFEIIAVVDGCRDDSFKVISEINSTDSRVKVVEFARNFGHQAAVSAGMAMAKGDLLTIIDDDLEDLPEVLELFKAKIDEGFDVVYGVRRARKRSVLHKFFYVLFYRVLGGLSDFK